MSIKLTIRTFNDEYTGIISEDGITLKTTHRVYQRDDKRYDENAFCYPKGTLFFFCVESIQNKDFRLRLSPNVTPLKSDSVYTAPDFFGDLRIFDVLENYEIWKESLSLRAYIRNDSDNQ